MMKTAYFDCFSGISGDMCLGAVMDAGVSHKKLENELKKIPVRGYRLTCAKVKRSHISSTKADVLLRSAVSGQQLAGRNWKDIKNIIQRSSLSQDIKQKGLNIFKRLFTAEASVHGEKFDKVHLHELGAVDCVVDIFGTIIGLNMLGVDKVYSSPVNLGSGSVHTEHGILPVPAPAVAEILKKVPVYSTAVSFELTTPTGAAIIREISSGFGDMPVMDFETIGIGAGSKNPKDRPNILRIFIGRMHPLTVDKGDETVFVIETNIDDMNPQIFEHVMEKLIKAGALDVFLTQIIMKKGRPGVKMTVLCKEEHKENLMKIMLVETSSIGLRFYEMKRKVLQRDVRELNTEFGKVRFKVSRYGNDILKMTPEYEDCKKIANKLNIPLIEIMKKIK